SAGRHSQSGTSGAGRINLDPACSSDGSAVSRPGEERSGPQQQQSEERFAAQDAGGASSALFAEQAEASVADGTFTRHAARASRRVPGMRRARNMAEPAFRRVSSMCYMLILARLFHVASAKSKSGSSCPSLLRTLLLENPRRKEPAGFEKNSK